MFSLDKAPLARALAGAFAGGSDLSAITVTATHTERHIDSVPNTVTVIPTAEIDKSGARASDAQQARIDDLALRQAPAGHLAGCRFDTLPGGEQARVQLARVFAPLWDERRALLLVDEPLAALDPGLQFELPDAMERFAAARGHALVGVLHDINQALAGFDRLWLLAAGRLVADAPSDRAAVERLEQLYGIALRCVEDGAGDLAVLPMRCPAAIA